MPVESYTFYVLQFLVPQFGPSFALRSFSRPAICYLLLNFQDNTLQFGSLF